MVYQFAAAIGTKAEEHLPKKESDGLDETKAKDKKKIAAKKKNSVAFATLTTAFTTEKLLMLIIKSKTAEWPSRLAWMVVAALLKKFQPLDRITHVELRQNLNKISMKKNKNPEILFEQISVAVNCAEVDADKMQEDLIAIVLDAASSEYKAVLTGKQRLQSENLKLKHLEEAMDQHWQTIKSKNRNDNKGSKVALGAFQGWCFLCKEKGHQAQDCPSKKGPKTTPAQCFGKKGEKISGKCFQ